MSGLGTLLGVWSMVVFIPGCPVLFPQPVWCSTDAECDDSNGCTTDRCSAGWTLTGTCSHFEACAADHCKSNACVACIADSECDDGTFCNGAEKCTNNVCAAGTNACADPTPKCDEGANACVECLANADCDDATFCNGAETCANGACVDGAAPCDAATETCDEDTNACVTK